ncbi:hypothetical protein AAVH_27106 [Aphelenchoides avenae]|nr:hypothetical protein AAVH_27106 [Aphelenchus avenae]
MSAIEESTTGTIIEGTAALRLAESGAPTSSPTSTFVGKYDAAEARSYASKSQQSSSQKAASTVGSSTDPNTTKKLNGV